MMVGTSWLVLIVEAQVRGLDETCDADEDWSRRELLPGLHGFHPGATIGRGTRLLQLSSRILVDPVRGVVV